MRPHAHGWAVTAGRLAFGAQGFCFISLTTRLPHLAARWRAGELAVSLVLLGIVLLAGVGSLLVERVAARRGSGPLLRLGLATVAAGLASVMLAPSLAVGAGGALLYGLGLGAVDAASNMQAAALEHRAGRPLLPSFYGAWTLGGVLAAGLALLTTGVPLEWAALLAVVPATVATTPFLARGEDHAVDTDVPGVAWRPLVMVGLALMVFYLLDTATATWGPLYLQHVGAPDRWVALASFPYLLATGAVRLAGDALTRRLGTLTVLRAGALVCVGALALVVLAPTWPLAVLGFTLLGAGSALVAPLSFSAAARIAGEQVTPALRQRLVDATIARFNQFNYLGALLGAVMTGVVGAGSLRVGFAVPMVLAVALWPLARWFTRSTT